jgi:microcystin-dependent protein
MSEPFIGEVRPWGLGYNPQGWLPCDGRQLAIVQYQVLAAVIGTTYGGDGIHYFNLPNLQGYSPMGTGVPNAQWQATGSMSDVELGATMGTITETLNYVSMPNHDHQTVGAIVGNTTLMTGTPTATTYLSRVAKPAATNAVTFSSWNNAATSNSQMSPTMIQAAGGSGAHENRQPFLVLNFYIACEGIFPFSN